MRDLYLLFGGVCGSTELCVIDLNRRHRLAYGKRTAVPRCLLQQSASLSFPQVECGTDLHSLCWVLGGTKKDPFVCHVQPGLPLLPYVFKEREEVALVSTTTFRISPSASFMLIGVGSTILLGPNPGWFLTS